MKRKVLFFALMLSALVISACNGKMPVLPRTSPQITEITQTSVTITWDAARLPNENENLGYEVYLHSDRTGYDQLKKGKGRKGDIFVTPGIRTGNETSVTFSITGNPGIRRYVSIIARNYDDDGLCYNVKTYALYPLVIAEVPEPEREDWPREYLAVEEDDDSEGELTVIRKTRQNEVVALHGRVEPETIHEIFSRYKVFIEPVGWTNKGIFAFRTTWFNDVMPGGGYALRIFDTVTCESIENDLLLLYYNWDESTDERTAQAEEIARIKTRWPRLLDRYGITGVIEDPAREIREGGYQSFEGSDYRCYFDYEIYGNKQWSEEIEWRLIVEFEGKRKTVFSTRIASDIVCGEKIIGYYKSPYENRIAVLVVNIVSGFEGAVDTSISFFGCDMDAGFE